MNQKFLIPCIVLSVFYFFSSCKKSGDGDIISPGGNTYTALSDTINTSFIGTVTDENDMVKAGVTIKAAGIITTTDSKGFFKITGAYLNKNGALITAEIPGYFKSFRTVTTNDSTIKFVKIKLIKRVQAGTVTSAVGGTVTLSDNTTISFPANAFINKSTGTAYTGSVNIFAAPVNPASADFAYIIPGSLMAVDSANNASLLQSYGMTITELEGSSGESLQLANGKTAVIDQPIPASLLSTAPATLPMWYLDEADGLWKEQGEAVKTGNSYQGNVSHFTFWNFDYSVKGIWLEMTLQDNSGNPLINTFIKIYNTATGVTNFDYTDSKGYLRIRFGQNLNFNLSVYGSCSAPVYNTTLGPYAQSTNLGIVHVNLGSNGLQIAGTVKNCNGNPVTQGNVLFLYEGVYHYMRIGTGGTFTAVIPTCHTSTSLDIYATDESTMTQSTLTTYNTTTTNLQALALVTCAPAQLGSGTIYIGTFAGSNYHMVALDVASGVIKWNVLVFSSGDIETTCTFANGKLYYRNQDGIGYFDTLTKANGILYPITPSPYWGLNYYYHATPLFYNNVLYCAETYSGTKFYKYDLATGTGSSNSGLNYAQDIEENSLTISNGILYSAVTATNLSDLSAIWANNVSVSSSGAAIDNGSLFYGYANAFYAKNTGTGTAKWTYQLDNYLNSQTHVNSSPTIADGKVFFGATDSSFYALDENTGALVWKKKTNGQIWASPIISNGKVIFNSWDKIVYALDINTGNVVWQQLLPSTGIYSSPVIAGGSAIITTNAGMYSIDVNTGFINWSTPISDPLKNSPIIVDDAGIVHHPGNSGEQN